MSAEIEDLRKRVRSMESDLFDVRRWGDLVAYFGRMPESPEPECLNVVGYAIAELGETLEHKWRDALDLKA